MTGKDESVIDVSGPLRAARDDHDAVVELTRELVRIPSRGGIDPCDPVLDYMASWLTEHDLLPAPGRAWRDDGRPDLRDHRNRSRTPLRTGRLPGHRPVRRRERLDLPADLR